MKAKKVLAMLMASAMIMGTSVTAFAAGTSSTITINNGEGQSFSYIQVIKVDPQEKTGWAFTTPAIESAYLDAFGVEDPQQVIEQMIKGKDGTGVSVDGKIADALEKVKNIEDLGLKSVTDKTPDDTKFTFDVYAAGVYYIQGTDTNTVVDDEGNVTVGYVYSPMAAYVSFSNEGGYNPDVLADADAIDAKRQPRYIEKDANDPVVEIGRTVEYTIDTTIPYIEPGESYIVTDQLTGANYATNDTGILKVKVYVGFDKDSINEDTPYETIDVAPRAAGEVDEYDYTFNADLSQFVEGHVNQNIVLKYSAVVTDIEVNNKVYQGNGENNFAENETDVTTATLTLNKKGENNVNLADAKFVLKNSENKYATFTTDSDGNYILTGTWEDNYKAGEGDTDDNDDSFIDSTVITTNENGQAVMKGLDGELGYTLVEVEAPDGYSLVNDTILEPVTESDSYWTDEENGDVTIVDTKLSALPSTGGIGTTIFTIGGCAIMVTAAGLYFATRKKTEK